MSFSHEVNRDGKLSFLNVNNFCEEGQFVTNFSRKTTFSGVYTHFESFLPATYKFGMVYTLAYRCFRICSDWTKFNQELRFLEGVFLKNGYPSGFIDSSFKKVIDNFLTESPAKLTVEKRLLILPLPFLGNISLELRTKLRKTFKNILSCCKAQIVFKSQRRLSNQFRFKEPLPYDLMSKVAYKYTCGRCNSSYYDSQYSKILHASGLLMC